MTSVEPSTTQAHGRRRRSRGPVLRSVLIAVSLLAWLGIAAFGGMAQGTLSEVQQNDQAAFLPDSAESTQAAELAREFSETTTLPALLVLQSSDGAQVTEEQLAAAQEFAEQIQDLEIGEGMTVGDYLTGAVVAVPSEDGEAILLPIPLDADQVNETVGEERVVNLVVDSVRTAAAEDLSEAGLNAWVTGPAGAVADLVTAFGGIDGILLLVALVVVLVILFIVYRSPTLPFTVLLTAVFALCLAALVIKPLAASGALLLNGQSQGILSILVVGAATDYSLLLVARYREELTRYERPADAMRVAWRASLEPILASSGTVIVGLLCLLLSDLGSNASLGPVAAIGIASAVIAALTLLPAILLVAGRRSRFFFWPRSPRYVDPHAAEDPHHHAATTLGLWQRVADFVARRDRSVWIVTAAVLLVGVAFVPTLRAEGTSDSDVFLNEVESVAGEEILAAHFDAGQVQPVTIIADESYGADLVSAAEDVDGVQSASLFTGETTTGRPADPGAEPVVVDGRVQVQVITEDAAETQEALVTVASLRDAAHAVDPEALVGGAAAQRLDTQVTAANDLRTIIPVVLLVIFVMLVLLLRAVVAPLIVLVANLLSFGFTMGLAAVVFNHVFKFPGADATVPLYGFVFLVALGIDYSIFLMTRVREESLQFGTREGVRRGLAVTGGVITSAGLVLAATFSALSVIPLLFLAQLAFIVAAGVLVDTFIVRSLLVPALVHDVGRPSWWPWTRRIPRDHQNTTPPAASEADADQRKQT
ncbi:MMPL family transporter [Occultella kanbiaonis]|uniref:MMPL family transporter n=1 Tax=Occultella kanbiaonis TaxID=2675754 RepID=UPI0012BA1EFD